MAHYLRPGLTQAQASRICMTECRAMCCRGPLVLELTAAEADAFQSAAAVLELSVQLSRRQDGSGWLKFADHPGERCPMLHPDTLACRIYADRPQRCRQFPERPTPGCPISGG